MNRQQRRELQRRKKKNKKRKPVIKKTDGWQLFRGDGHFAGRFGAMASPCEILIQESSSLLAEECVELAFQETLRIEKKFSRYLEDNIVFEINNSNGDWVSVDSETENLLKYADQCFEMSEGLFDITSGVLRKAWQFDGSAMVPSPEQVDKVLPLVGWQRVQLRPGEIKLEKNMQIDFGGIGKEYAVDRVASMVGRKTKKPFLVNFGGDLFASQERTSGEAWTVGIESPEADRVAIKNLKLKKGALATSGDARRFVLKDGLRFGHVINPKTGWPIEKAPRSVTVSAGTCTEAGILATLALLQGSGSEDFLQAQGCKHWCFRDPS